jgi:hypothetical protein
MKILSPPKGSIGLILQRSLYSKDHSQCSQHFKEPAEGSTILFASVVTHAVQVMVHFLNIYSLRGIILNFSHIYLHCKKIKDSNKSLMCP